VALADCVLIDGRNRLAACKLANVEPIFETLPDGEDAVAYIDLMDERRNVSKGQRAMAKAMRYPEVKVGGKRIKGSGSETERGFSNVRLSNARSVLRHSRSLAEAVVKGITPLDAALAKMKEEEQYQMGDEAKTFTAKPTFFRVGSFVKGYLCGYFLNQTNANCLYFKYLQAGYQSFSRTLLCLSKIFAPEPSVNATEPKKERCHFIQTGSLLSHRYGTILTIVS
jgi:hypothetical protein